MIGKRIYRKSLIGGLFLFAALTPAALCAPANVLTWHNDNARSGVNPNETVLAPTNVNQTDFGKLFDIPVDGQVFAQPLYVFGVAIPERGTHNMLYIATEHASVYACDADDGSVLWQVTLLGSGETPSDNMNCDIMRELGVTATPVITGEVIYVQAMSKDGNGNYFQRLHGLDIRTGEELFGGPVDIAATYNGFGSETVFDPKPQFDRAGLVLQDGVIYTCWSSFCDHNTYHGWIIGYDTSLNQVRVVNLTPNGEEGSIWASGAAPAADSNGHLFLMTANGTFDTVLDPDGFPGQGDFGNTFVNLGPGSNGTLSVFDYFAPFNTVEESAKDLDLGSGGTLLLPDMLDGSGQIRHLAVGAGKDSHIYIVDRDNMGKFNPDSNDNIYQDVVGSIFGFALSSPAFFNGHLYYGIWTDRLRSFQFTDARLDPMPVSVTPTVFGFPGITPAISANGTSNGIVWAAEYTSPAILHAYEADDVSVELYNSNQAQDNRDQFGAGVRFVVPTIANEKVYVGADENVGVFGLFNPPRLANLSTRAQIGIGDDVLIGGIIIEGGAPRELVLRGIGPSLNVDGVPVSGVLQDPVLELEDSSGAVIATNDNWGDSPEVGDILAAGLAPSDSLESAVLVTLDPGSYTVILHGEDDSTGIGLFELYDISETPNTTLRNLSARGFVGTGDDALIGGLIVTGVASQNVILRAIGPDLASKGVSGSLANPTLELHDGNGILIQSNDNWRSDQEAEIMATGLEPADDLDAAIVDTLAPGSYTAIVRGVGGSSGIALVETYALF
jgi:outer membrane protein assembly factor BamB